MLLERCLPTTIVFEKAAGLRSVCDWGGGRRFEIRCQSMPTSSWECPACTFGNDHPHECIMRQSARPPLLGGGRRTRLAAAATESTAREVNVNNDVCRGDNSNYKNRCSIEPPPNHHGDDAKNDDISQRQRQTLLIIGR